MPWLTQAQSHVKQLCPIYLQLSAPKKISPAALIWSNSSHSCRLEEGSMPLVGSSKKTTGVSPSRAVATHNRRFCPPERVVHWSSTFSGIPKSRNHTKPKGQHSNSPAPLVLMKVVHVFHCFSLDTSFRTWLWDTLGGKFSSNGSQRPSAVKTSITLLLCSLTPRKLAKNIKCWRTVKTS